MDNEKMLEIIKGMFETQNAELKQSIKELDQKTTAIQQDIRILSDKMDKGFKDTRSELVDAVDSVGQRVDNLAKTMNDVETVTAQNAFDVQLMKRRA